MPSLRPSGLHRVRLILVLLAAAFAAPAHAQTFIDNSFTTGWHTFVYAQSPASPAVTATATHFPSILPNRRRLTHNYYSGASIFAHHLGMTQHYLPASTQIANIQFKYTIATLGSAVRYAPLVVQGGSFYSASFDTATAVPTAYNRVLTAADFFLIKPDGSLDPNQHPDFSCTGPATQMGYNTTSSDPGPLNPANPISTVSDLSAWEVVVATQPCGTSSTTSSACCPPWSKTSMTAQLRLFQPGPITSPYTFKFVPAAPYQAQMQTYVNYLNSTNAAITTLIVDWTITDQGNGVAPIVPTTTIIAATASNSWTCTGCSPPPPNTTFPIANLTPNRWYRVTARLKLNGGLTFWPADCPVASFDYNIRIL